MLGQQFMHNAGAPYKFVIKTLTQPFDECAPVITEALELLRERVRMVIPEIEFNEILSVAYMQGQRMEVHSLILTLDAWRRPLILGRDLMVPERKVAFDEFRG